MSSFLIGLALETDGLSTTEKLTLVVLADAANPDNGDACWPSMKRIAHRVGTTTRSVQRCLTALEDKGLIIREHRQHDNGGPSRSNLYTVLLRRVTECHPGVTPASPPPDTDVTPEGDTRVTPLNRNIEPKIETEERGRPLSHRELIGMVYNDWNSMARRVGLSPIRKMSEPRCRAALRTIKEHGQGGWAEIVAKVEASRFLRGANDRGWCSDIDFVLKPTNQLKILEGKYDDADPRPNGPTVDDLAVNYLERRRAGLN